MAICIHKPEILKGLVLVCCFYFYLFLCRTTNLFLCQLILFFFSLSKVPQIMGAWIFHKVLEGHLFSFFLLTPYFFSCSDP